MQDRDRGRQRPPEGASSRAGFPPQPFRRLAWHRRAGGGLYEPSFGRRRRAARRAVCVCFRQDVDLNVYHEMCCVEDAGDVLHHSPANQVQQKRLMEVYQQASSASTSPMDRGYMEGSLHTFYEVFVSPPESRVKRDRCSDVHACMKCTRFDEPATSTPASSQTWTSTSLLNPSSL